MAHARGVIVLAAAAARGAGLRLRRRADQEDADRQRQGPQGADAARDPDRAGARPPPRAPRRRRRLRRGPLPLPDRPEPPDPRARRPTADATGRGDSRGRRSEFLAEEQVAGRRPGRCRSPASVKLGSRMFARCSGEPIHAATTDRRVGIVARDVLAEPGVTVADERGASDQVRLSDAAAGRGPSGRAAAMSRAWIWAAMTS